jgi:uncharacterized membrane protein
MRWTAFFIYFIYFFLTLSGAYAQTVKGRSTAIQLAVDEDKVPRANLSFSNVGLDDANRNRTLEAYEQAVIRFVIKNAGKTATRGLRIRAYLPEEVPGLTLPETLVIEPLPPGKSQEVRLPVKTAAELPSSTAVVTIEVREDGIFETNEIEINVLTEATAASGNN